MPTIIEEILEKYNLKKTQQEGIEKFFKLQDPQKRREVFENLPGAKISKLVVEYSEGKISLEDLSSRLKKELNISDKKAEEIAEELKKSFPVFIKPPEEKELPPEIKPPVGPVEKPKPLRKTDIYREPIG